MADDSVQSEASINLKTVLRKVWQFHDDQIQTLSRLTAPSADDMSSFMFEPFELENVEPWLDTVSENLDLDHFEDVQWEDKRPYFEPELVRVRSDADGDSNWDGSRDPSDQVDCWTGTEWSDDSGDPSNSATNSSENSTEHYIDHCANGNHTCHTNADCSNNDDNFSCSCKSGYSGDGENCNDIDECITGTHFWFVWRMFKY